MGDAKCDRKSDDLKGADNFKKPNGKAGHLKGKTHDGRKVPYQNPLSHWSKYPELLQVAASIPWLIVQGAEVRDTWADFTPSHVSRYYFNPTIGDSANATSAINLIFQRLYVKLNTKFRGVTNVYQAPDLAMVTIALGNLFLRLAEAERAYATAQTYMTLDRSFARAMLKAEGFTDVFIDDLFKNMANFRLRINTMITQLNTLCLPAGFSFVEEWLSLVSYIYRDSEDDKNADIIVFVPNTYYVYRDDIEGVPNSLVSKIIDRGSYANYLDDIDAEIARLLANREVIKMCADMFAYLSDTATKKPGSTPTTIQLETLPEQVYVYPIYSKQLLNKIHNGIVVDEEWSNACILNHTVPEAYLEAIASYIGDHDDVRHLITQFNGYVAGSYSFGYNDDNAQSKTFNDNGYSEAIFRYKENHVVGDKWSTANIPPIGTENNIIDTWERDPSLETITEMTLFRFTGKGMLEVSKKDADVTIRYAYLIKSICFVQLCGLDLIQIAGEDITNSVFVDSFRLDDRDAVALRALSKFDWHPLLFTMHDFGYNISVDSAPTITLPWLYDEPFGDLDNFTVVSSAIISKIHDVVCLSGYTIEMTQIGYNNK